jgi:hypothetical protein
LAASTVIVNERCAIARFLPHVLVRSNLSELIISNFEWNKKSTRENNIEITKYFLRNFFIKYLVRVTFMFETFSMKIINNDQRLMVVGQ